MAYKIQVLSDQEFDNLPYPESETSLGIADPETGTAYVRFTHFPELNKHTINHELEHLIEGHGGKDSHHYRNGVYYKGFGEILQMAAPLLSFIPGVGPLLSAGAGVGGGFASQKSPQKQMSQGGSQGGFGGFGNSGMQSSAPTEFRPSQSGPAAPSITSPAGQGASGGTGAVGQSDLGSPVDAVRKQLQGNQGNFQKGNYAGRGGL